MKRKFCWKIISLFLVIATLVTTLPLSVFAEEIKDESTSQAEIYIKDVKLVRAETKEEAYNKFAAAGYEYLDSNLNEGTDGDGVWMGYTTTTDPSEAIYDMKLMNMKGGFTRTSMEEALSSQKTAFAEMASDLDYLVDEFAKAYNANRAPAKNAYTALNFFRVVENETEYAEENGLGYQLVHGGVTLATLTEILLFCDPIIVDSIIKILTMGIQIHTGNWLQALSNIGPYEEDTEYMEDEAELLRRAEQLLSVLQLYAEIYVVMLKSGLLPDDFDENMNPIYNKDRKNSPLTAEEAELQKLDEARYKFYKLAADELAKYEYGDEGETLLDFFVSLATEDNEKALYPMVKALSDGAFSALSYGCFLEMVIGADTTSDEFDSYESIYNDITAEESSVYLYTGVDKALFDDEAIVGFTDTAQRHMASTGELNFFESDNTDERLWESGKRVVTCIGVACLVIMGLTKITVGVTSLIVAASASLTTAKSAAVAATLKYGAIIGGLKGLIVAAVIVALSLLTAYVVAVIGDNWSDNIDWEDDPLLDYMYDVKEVTLAQSSDDGVSTGLMRRPVFALYKAVDDIDNNPMELNAYYGEGEWLQMFVSYDRQGQDASPIKAEDLLVQLGSGVTPEGYLPLSRFGDVYAYNLNAGDLEDTVNGIYFFYKQDHEVAVDSGVTYYISDVQLQMGESDAHCIKLLQDAGYTPINVNLSPDLTDGDFLFEDKVYTYIGYKVTTSEDYAIRDIRLVYGPSQGSIQYGAATYADCGTNGVVTLYATKYSISGTPILAGSLTCVDEKNEIAAGYEPVCLMSGGPAVPVNPNNDGELRAENGFFYLYFLPETTFTDGKQYLGGIAVFGTPYDYQQSAANTKIIIPDSVKAMWGDYVPAAWASVGSFNRYERYIDTVYYYPTYNPYRAIYSIKAAEIPDYPNSLIIESNSYYLWNEIKWSFEWNKEALEKDFKDRDVKKDTTLTIRTVPGEDDVKSAGAFYLSGNTKSDNIYDAKEGAMTVAQPIEISEVLFFEASNPDYIKSVPEGFYPVIDSLSNNIDIPLYYNHFGFGEFVIYTKSQNEERPYVSNIFAIDQLTLFRDNGGTEAGLTADLITEDKLYAYLTSKGATQVISYSANTYATNIWGSLLGALDQINMTKFGYTRTAKTSKALRDVFLYFNEFSTDEPPKEIYRGSVKYTMLCEIPYNLLGFADAPSAGVYLYGATSSKAGERIVDLQISSLPFMDGYETVRTMGGRSLMSEIKDYAKHQQSVNPVEESKAFFEALYSFFDNDDGKMQAPNYYLHIKREKDTGGDDLYIKQLYLASANKDWGTLLDTLFDQGAEGCVEVSLNTGTVGEAIYLGYSYTSKVDEALKEIRAYHSKNPPTTMTDDNGNVFTLVSDLDLNKGAGGNYIYLYTSKTSTTQNPITDVSVAFKVTTITRGVKTASGEIITTQTQATKQWDSSKNSDLNKGAGGEYVYLMYTTTSQKVDGTPAKEPNYGKDKTYTRYDYLNKKADGKYVGGLYVMDKETIRLEKIASGALPTSATCNDISDDEVFARLTAMGATTIIKTPISLNSGAYFKNNRNKVYIGYSRTDSSVDAIRNIAIKAELMTLDQPKAEVNINSKPHTIVAEAASSVTELPKPINLIGIEGGAEINIPRLYLYYSIATGNDPIYDITIDDLPILNGYNTVRSANLIDAFTDIYNQASEMSELATNDQMLTGAHKVYTDELAAWMGEIADYFDPAEDTLKPFYIHMKRHNAASLEEVKPYIGDIYLAEAESSHEALAKLVAFEPDGYVAVDLNQDAGGNYVYMAYKRVAKSRDALTDIVVYEGKKFEPTRRITFGDNTVKYSLADDIDLNCNAGGKYLYMYTTDSKYAGGAIMSLEVKEQAESSVKCGVERITARRAEGSKYTDEQIDLNKNAGGDCLYLIMSRETTEGHTSNGIVTEEIFVEETCADDGYRSEISQCADCGESMEIVIEVIEAHGMHIDDEEDGDHYCDECGADEASAHKWQNFTVKSDVLGGYEAISRCAECEEEKPYSSATASLIGNGSFIAVISIAGIAILAAIIIYLKRRTTTEKAGKENEK